MNIFLIVAIAVIVVCVLLGIKKGFVRTVFNMCSLFIVILITSLLSPFVADYVRNHTEIPNKVEKKLEEMVDLKDKVGKTDKEISQVVEKIEVPEKIKTLIINKGTKDQSTNNTGVKEGLVDNIYDRVTNLIVSAIAYIFTFAVVLVIVIVVGLLLDIVAKLPVIKQANEVLGAVFGLAEGYLIVTVLYLLALAFAATQVGSAVIEMVNRNEVLTWFYDHNPIVDMIFGLIK